MKKLGVLAAGMLFSINAMAIDRPEVPDLDRDSIKLPDGYKIREVESETKLQKLTEDGVDKTCYLKVTLPMLQFPIPAEPSDEEKKVIERIEKVHKHLYNRGESSLRSFLTAVQDNWQCKGNYSTAWTQDLDYNITGVFGHLVSIVYSYYSYTGGAHGYGGYESEIFDFQEGGVVPSGLDQFLKSDLQTLNAIKQMLFLKLRQHQLFDKDFGWNDWQRNIHQMTQIDNFFLTKNGLSFFWNPYEIGSYAEGHYIVALSWEELEPYAIFTKYSAKTPLMQ